MTRADTKNSRLLLDKDTGTPPRFVVVFVQANGRITKVELWA